MKKRKTPFRSAEKKKPAAKPSKPSKQGGASSTKKTRPAASLREPEVRRAIPLNYVATEDVELRSAPDFAASKLPGGLLGKGTVVRIAPQDWWYVEVERPATASGVLRGWLANALLRRATPAEEEAMSHAAEPSLPFAPTATLSRAELRAKMAKSIVDFEARRDAQGHLKVYNLPANDGGGRYEVAGINERYHPREAAKLRDLINAKRYVEAEDYATDVIAKYTDVVSKWTTVPAIEAFLRDCAFNRGPGGAAKILQMALGVKVDGGVGPETLGALRRAERDPAKLLARLRVAREQYELKVAGRRGNLWQGLVNRWNNSLHFARSLA
jgi:Predicted Peptidoglycan domain